MTFCHKKKVWSSSAIANLMQTHRTYQYFQNFERQTHSITIFVKTKFHKSITRKCWSSAFMRFMVVVNSQNDAKVDSAVFHASFDQVFACLGKIFEIIIYMVNIKFIIAHNF